MSTIDRVLGWFSGALAVGLAGFLALALVLQAAGLGPARAQGAQDYGNVTAYTVQNCGSPPVGYTASTISQAYPGAFTVNTSGQLCMAVTPSSSASIGITPQVCGPSASTCALKTSGGGNLYGAYAQASSSVYLFIFNTTSAPANGSTTSGTASGNLVDCIGPSTQPSINYAPGPPEVFSAGMYAALSSTACGTLTLTTGTIHGSVQ